MDVLTEMPLPTFVDTPKGRRHFIAVAPRPAVNGLSDTHAVLFVRPETNDYAVADLVRDEQGQRSFLVFNESAPTYAEAMVSWAYRVTHDATLFAAETAATAGEPAKRTTPHEHSSWMLQESARTGGVYCGACGEGVAQGPVTLRGDIIKTLDPATRQSLRGVWR